MLFDWMPVHRHLHRPHLNLPQIPADLLAKLHKRSAFFLVLFYDGLRVHGAPKREQTEDFPSFAIYPLPSHVSLGSHWPLNRIIATAKLIREAIEKLCLKRHISTVF